MDQEDEREALDWHGRLRTRSVTNADLADFAAWRRRPGKAEAYARVEALWRDAGALDRDPDVIAAVEAAQHVRRPANLGRSRFALAAALGAILLAVLIAGLAYRRFAPDTYRTGIGERAAVVLADGSRMTVDADSAVTVSLSTRARRLEVRSGRAVFDVEHDPRRPFEVGTGSGVLVKALGTRFAVAVEDGGTSVALLRGSVSVSRGGTLIRKLAAGETLWVPPSGEPTLSIGRAEEVTSWASGKLALRNVQLSDAVRQMNRYAAPAIVLNSADAGSELISGEFSIDDPDGFVGGVNALMGAGTVRRADGS